MGGILGGGGGGGGAKDMTPSRYRKELRPPVSSTLSGILTGNAPSLSGVPQYNGQYTAPPTAQEQSIIDALANNATGQGGMGSAVTNFLHGTLNGDGSITTNPYAANPGAAGLVNDTISGKYLDPSSNPYLQGSISAAIQPILDTYKQTTLPNLRSQFTAAGQMIQPGGSSPFDTALGQAQTGLANAIGSTTSNIVAQNYQSERDRQLAAGNTALQATGQQQSAEQANQTNKQAAAGLSNDQVNSMVQSLQAVALPRLISQYGLDQGVQQFNTSLNTLLQALGLAGNLSVAQAATVTPASGGGGLGGLLNGLGTAAIGGAQIHGAFK